MRGLTRFLSGMLTLAFIMMLLAGAGIAWFQHAVDDKGPLQTSVTVVVPLGDSTRMIADRLEKLGVISEQRVFLAHAMAQEATARMSGRPARHMKAGEYELQAGISVREIVQKLSEGRSLLYAVTVPEGLTSYEIVERLRRDANLSGAISQLPPEGSLLPETFKVPRGTPRAQVLAMLNREQSTFLEKAWQGRKPDLPLRSMQEALVLASIVEKETGPNDDPARVAAVFVNRLRRNIRLQSDPTILYGKLAPNVDWGAKIFRSDINRKTAYNTYQIDGLPPTPICNPGRRSIEAVMQPAETRELYFVADGKGGHIFSETLADHERAVRDWRKIERDIRERQAEAANGTGVVTAKAAADVAPTLINNKTVSTVQIKPGSDPTVPLPVKRPNR